MERFPNEQAKNPNNSSVDVHGDWLYTQRSRIFSWGNAVSYTDIDRVPT